ncbi:ImmA/IrrE family metallo-endopeptidase [Streptomyces sp. NPDC048479]|uniref:ImmA/IrrE family metallo-endopeptidase n=1 Tax=Streptomyces sp. NPDC048479 TaxID=3154725 RepID=UPI003423E0A9
MSWNDAHGAAMIAVAQAHEALEVKRDGYIDVFGALKTARIEVVGQPMGGLLGLYAAPADGGPACMLNCGLDEAGMRHTLAHELGHHRMGHGTSVDHEEYSSGRWGEGWPQHEKEAEAFASWFLMPRSAALGALARCGISHPASPWDVYRMARWLGMPYATTVRHLVRLKMIDRSTEALWLKHSPGALKAELAAGLPLGGGAHIHLLGPAAHRGTVYAATGDCLLLEMPALHWDGAPSGVSTTAPAAEGQLSLLGETIPVPRSLWVTDECTAPLMLTASATSGEVFAVTVHRTPHRRGSDHFWV